MPVDSSAFIPSLSDLQVTSTHLELGSRADGVTEDPSGPARFPHPGLALTDAASGHGPADLANPAFRRCNTDRGILFSNESEPGHRAC